MSLQSDLLDRLTDQDGREPLFLPDLVRWFQCNGRRGTLPARYAGWSLSEICRDMGLPIWDVVRPWNVQTPGLSVQERESDTELFREVETVAGVLVWRWERAPDGSWQQVEHPIKGAADLPAAVEWSRALEYTLDTGGLTEREMAIGDGGLLAIELPPRPLMQIMTELLGRGDRLALLGEPAIEHLLQQLENRLQSLVTSLAQTSVPVHYAPDQLEDALVSEALARQHLLPSYRRTMRELHEFRKRLVIEARGSIGGLLQGLARAGVHAVAGFTCAPQGAGSLGDLHERAEGRATLWGGIPQEALLPQTDAARFETVIRSAARAAQGRQRLILGIAGGVPVEADLGRLRAVPHLIRRAIA